MRLLRLGSLAFLLLEACAWGKKPRAVALPDGGALAVPSAVAAKASTADPEENAELIVGTAWGLEAWRRDGSGKRLIGEGAARYPRWLDKGTVLVVHPKDGDDFAAGGTIESIALADGRRARVAELPPFSCGSDEGDALLGLAIQDPNDFVVDKSGKVVCLTLMDRNINMVSLAVAARVELATGEVSRWLELGEHECTPPKEVTVGKMAECSPRQPGEPLPVEQPGPFAFQAGEVVDRSDAAPAQSRVKLAGYESVLDSPSRRWEVLRGDVEEGDYIRSRLVLLDRTTGELFPVRAQPSPWPAPLKPAGSKPPQRIRTPVKGTIVVVGESDLRWLGRSAASELLVIDDLVVRPGRASFAVKGLVAQ